MQSHNEITSVEQVVVAFHHAHDDFDWDGLAQMLTADFVAVGGQQRVQIDKVTFLAVCRDLEATFPALHHVAGPCRVARAGTRFEADQNVITTYVGAGAIGRSVGSRLKFVIDAGSMLIERVEAVDVWRSADAPDLASELESSATISAERG